MAPVARGTIGFPTPTATQRKEPEAPTEPRQEQPSEHARDRQLLTVSCHLCVTVLPKPQRTNQSLEFRTRHPLGVSLYLLVESRRTSRIPEGSHGFRGYKAMDHLSSVLLFSTENLNMGVG